MQGTNILQMRASKVTKEMCQGFSILSNICHFSIFYLSRDLVDVDFWILKTKKSVKYEEYRKYGLSCLIFLSNKPRGKCHYSRTELVQDYLFWYLYFLYEKIVFTTIFFLLVLFNWIAFVFSLCLFHLIGFKSIEPVTFLPFTWGPRQGGLCDPLGNIVVI